MRNALKWLCLVLVALVSVAAMGGHSAAHAATVHGFMLDSLRDSIHVMPIHIVGATLGANVLTLSDWAKRLDPNGQVPDIVEMLNQTNEVLDDMGFIEGNLPTGHRTTVRTGLPSVAWRLLNQGVQVSKSTTAQIDEAIGLLEAWAEVDCELARLSGNESEFRLSEAQAFIEAMNQEMARTLWYGNSGIDPEKFTGLSVRYSSSTAKNGQNVVKGTGTPSGSDQTSMWLVTWGPRTLTGIFPKASKVGLTHNDLGEQTIDMGTSLGGSRMRVYQDQFIWKLGIALRDWRYCVRICNLDVSNILANPSTPAPDILFAMAKATWRIPALGMGRPVFYCNRTVAEYLDIQAQASVKVGGQLSYDVVDGKRITSFRGIPIKISDQLVETESIIS